MRRFGYRAQRGFALLLSLIVAAVLTGAVLIVVDEGTMELAMSRNQMEAVRAKWLARGAAHHAAWRMRYDLGYRKDAEINLVASVDGDSLDTGTYRYRATAGGTDPVDWLLDGWAGQKFQMPTTHRVPNGKLTPSHIVRCTADAMLWEGDGNANFGVATVAVTVNTGDRSRPVLYFPVPVDTSLVVQSATLRMWLLEAGGDDDLVIGPSFLTEPWVEGSGEGTHSHDGCTWIERSGSSNWTTPGGTFDPALQSELLVGLETGVLQWDVTALVQSWIHGDIPNYGLILKAKNEMEVNPMIEKRVFASRERPDTDHCPVLVIEFDTINGPSVSEIVAALS